MGRKVHPTGFRIGTIRDWQAKWYADKHYPEFIQEDAKIRKAIRSKYADAGVSLVEIERQSNRVTINIHTSRPGIVIGRGGQRVDETRHYLEQLIGKKIQLNIQEIRQPELDAYLVARMVAEQMERRIAYRRAMKQSIFRTMQAGAQGMRIICSGRLGGVEIARRQMMHQGRVPLHTLRADIDYGFTEAHTTLGRIGIKVWIYRGDILPEVEEEVIEGAVVAPTAEVVAEAEAAEKPREAPAKEKEKKPEAEKVAAGKEAPVEEKKEEPKEEKTAVVAEEAPAEKKEEKAKPKAKKAAKKKVEEEEKPAEAETAEKEKPEKAEKKAKPKVKKVTKKAAEDKKAVKETKKKTTKKSTAKKEETAAEDTAKAAEDTGEE